MVNYFERSIVNDMASGGLEMDKEGALKPLQIRLYSLLKICLLPTALSQSMQQCYEKRMAALIATACT